MRRKWTTLFRQYLCPGCSYPMCDLSCATGPIHKKECEIISRCPPSNRPSTLQIDNFDRPSNAYAIITPLRLLLLEEENNDKWHRTNQLMDHYTGTEKRWTPCILKNSSFSERVSNIEEWSWYEKYIVNYFLHDLKLAGRFTPAQIHRAIGLINVNAVALKFPMNSCPRGNFTYFSIFEWF